MNFSPSFIVHKANSTVEFASVIDNILVIDLGLSLNSLDIEFALCTISNITIINKSIFALLRTSFYTMDYFNKFSDSRRAELLGMTMTILSTSIFL